MGQVPVLPLDDVQVAAGPSGLRPFALQQGGGAGDAGEWVSQFVAQQRDKLILGGVFFLRGFAGVNLRLQQSRALCFHRLTGLPLSGQQVPGVAQGQVEGVDLVQRGGRYRRLLTLAERCCCSGGHFNALQKLVREISGHHRPGRKCRREAHHHRRDREPG